MYLTNLFTLQLSKGRPVEDFSDPRCSYRWSQY